MIKPTVNARRPLYGSLEFSADELPLLDPVTNEVWPFTAPAMEGTQVAPGGYARLVVYFFAGARLIVTNKIRLVALW